MFDRASAQQLIDALSCVTLLASAAARTDARADPLNSRMRFALGVLAAFYGLRWASEASGFGFLDDASLLAVSVVPLSALFLIEGLMRRHAPKVFKIGVAAGAMVAAGVVIVSPLRSAIPHWSLLAYEITTFGGLAVLILTRQRDSLSQQENVLLDAVLVAGLGLVPLIVSDFMDAAPVGSSGLGAAATALVLSANAHSRREAARAYLGLGLFVAVSAAAAAPVARALDLPWPSGALRLWAVLYVLLLAAGALQSLLLARRGSTSQAFLQALAASDRATLDGLLSDLADQPLLAGLRVLGPADLDGLDPVGLIDGLQTGPVERALSGAPQDREGRAGTSPWTELDELLSRHDANQALLLQRTPLRIGLLTLAGGGADTQTRSALAYFQKLALLLRPEAQA